MMKYEYRNQEHTMIAEIDSDENVVLIEPGHERWEEVSAMTGIAEYIQPEEPPANEILKRDIENEIETILHIAARKKGYDSIVSACSYAGYANPFQNEGQAFLEWRGSIWEYCYQQLADVESGIRTAPSSADEFIAEIQSLFPAPF